MTLAGTYTVYGYIYNEDGTPANNATVTIVDVINNQGTETFTTGATGYYQINIQNIADDGDDILVEAELSSGYVYGECFTLNLYDSPKNINITVEEYEYLEITSNTYTIKLRFCPIDNPERNITNDINVVNLWKDDEIDTIDEGLNTEPFNFDGVEYAEDAKTICYIARKFELLWEIMDNNEEITINKFGTCFDSIYVIRNFSFNSIQKHPNAYAWKLDLERVRDI